jgi:hypothetical protein
MSGDTDFYNLSIVAVESIICINIYAFVALPDREKRVALADRC